MNRRRGARSFLRKPDLGRWLAALRRLRLPAWSRRNRKKLKLRASADADRSAAAGTAPAGASGPRRGALGLLIGVVSFVAPLAAALVAFAMPLLGVRAYEYVMQSGYFHVREVLVDHVTQPGRAPAEPHLAREELLAIAGIDAGTHVIDADVQAMTKRLSEHPWVRWAQVERELPDRLVVHVVEHRPAAYLAATELYVVDELGLPFALAPADLTLALPVLSGVATERLSDPQQMPAVVQELAAGLNILRIWEAQGLSRRYPIGELRLQAGGSVAIVLEGKTVGTATEIVLGRGPFREKLFRVEWVLEHLRSIGKSAEYVLLDLADDMPHTGAGSAVEMGGARVVVKSDLGPESIESAGRKPAPLAIAEPPSLPAAPGPRQDANRHATPSPNSPESPTSGADLEEGAEAAPVSGGRPADDDGQE